MALSAKERYKAKIIEYIGNPENDFPSRTDIAITVLGFAKYQSLYNNYTAAELDEIEREAFEVRKARTVKQRAEIYTALHREAKAGNVQAAKEFLDRTEGKVRDKVDVNHSGSIETLSDVELDLKIKGLMEGLNASNGD